MITKIMLIPSMMGGDPRSYNEVESLDDVPPDFTPVVAKGDVVEGENFLANGQRVAAHFVSDEDGGRVVENGEWAEYGTWVLSAE
jgi:hypothetical protein